MLRAARGDGGPAAAPGEGATAVDHSALDVHVFSSSDSDDLVTAASRRRRRRAGQRPRPMPTPPPAQPPGGAPPLPPSGAPDRESAAELLRLCRSGRAAEVAALAARLELATAEAAAVSLGGRTALHAACASRSLATVRLLLGQGEPPAAPEEEEEEAGELSQTPPLPQPPPQPPPKELLLARDAEGRTALTVAAGLLGPAEEEDDHAGGAGDDPEPIARAVLSACRDCGCCPAALLSEDLYGRRPLHAALLSRRPPAALVKDERLRREAAADAVSRLLVWECAERAPEALSAATRQGDTPLHIAARSGGETEAAAGAAGKGRPPAVVEDLLLALCAAHDEDLRGVLRAAPPPPPGPAPPQPSPTSGLPSGLAAAAALLQPQQRPAPACPWAACAAAQQQRAAQAALRCGGDAPSVGLGLGPGRGCLLTVNSERVFPLTGQQAAALLRGTRHRAVALALLRSHGRLGPSTGPSGSPQPFLFPIAGDAIDIILEREGAPWLDVLDLMVAKADPPLRYSWEALCCAAGGLLVLADEASDWGVCMLLLGDGLWGWALCSIGVLCLGQMLLPALLARTAQSGSYRHALEWLPSGRLRAVPVLYHALIFWRACRALYPVSNLSEAKSLLGLTYAVGFMEAVFESAPQAALQVLVFRHKRRDGGGSAASGSREELLLFLSISFSALSILKAIATYAWFKWSHRAGASRGSGSNALGIIRLPEGHTRAVRRRPPPRPAPGPGGTPPPRSRTGSTASFLPSQQTPKCSPELPATEPARPSPAAAAAARAPPAESAPAPPTPAVSASAVQDALAADGGAAAAPSTPSPPAAAPSPAAAAPSPAAAAPSPAAAAAAEEEPQPPPPSAPAA